MEEIKILAEAGDDSAQFSLGLFYYDEEMYDEALFWFNKASAQGNLGAKIYSAICMLSGFVNKREALAY